MAEATMRKTRAEERAEMRAEIDASFAEIKRLRAEMKEAQERINQSMKRTRDKAAEIDAILARLKVGV